jgi:drug/metabolite transporter (DMT)-like permease
VRPNDAIKLILLSAIWGASFLFMRITAPELGPFLTTFARVAIAALALAPFLLRAEHRKALRSHKFSLLTLGIFNSAVPFSLLCWASLQLEAGFTSLLNATTPICAAVIGFWWLRIPLSRLQVGGLAIGLSGIAILTGNQLDFTRDGAGWPIVAVLCATCCYAYAGHYAKSRLPDVSPLAVSAGSLLASTLALLPFVFVFTPPQAPEAGTIFSVLALGLLCTAFAFILFFDLLKRNGATAATTVTFIIPVFGILWGSLFLQEEITNRMILGMAVALLGTAFVTKLIPRQH